ncbi:hypothetical protein [Jatrophihabitans sp.]|uniref:hypothetical protein n=1 Tax=Jatrophihabitans sp. TaxID=1932789 RepID=UPI0038CD731D
MTASTQTIIVGEPNLVVVVNGKRISAMPFRIRLIGQASPFAYSLDITRQVQYGDTWTGLSLGRPANNADRSLSAIGVNDPLIAGLIARGNRGSDQQVLYAETNFELAARQIAIWKYTNNLPLVPQVVPNASLLARAQQLADGASNTNLRIPLQPAHYSIGVFVRETTGNTVRLAITLGVDQNTSLSTPATIDLEIDGKPCAPKPGRQQNKTHTDLCEVRTRGHTRLEQLQDGTYRIAEQTDYAEATHSTQIADVDLPRNTKVVSLSANWVNVTSQPGLVMAGNGAAPPLVTAEKATMNFTVRTELDPDTFTGPTQLLNKAGTSALTHVPTWAILPVLVAALYLLARAGRGVDRLLISTWRKIRRSRTPPSSGPRRSSSKPQLTTPPSLPSTYRRKRRSASTSYSRQLQRNRIPPL